MSTPPFYRPVIIKFPAAIGYEPLPKALARERFTALLDALDPHTLCAVADEHEVWDWWTDTDLESRISAASPGAQLNVHALASDPQIVNELRKELDTAIDLVCWERSVAGPWGRVTEDNIDHIGGSPYAVVITADDDEYGPLRFLKSLERHFDVHAPAPTTP